MSARNVAKRISISCIVFAAVGLSVSLVFNVYAWDYTIPPDQIAKMTYRSGCKFTDRDPYFNYSVPRSYTESNANNGWSSVMSKSRVDPGPDVPSSGDVYGDVNDYSDTTYAKPGDYATFTHCYFPGVQRVAGSYVSIPQHNANETGTTIHPTIVANSSSTTINNIANYTMAKLTESEINDPNKGHLGFPQHSGVDSSFREFANEGTWTTIPNYARVDSHLFKAGGLNIYNNVDESATGKDGINFVDNTYLVGGDYLSSVGKYEERIYLPQPNHVTISNGVNHVWSCKYSVHANNCFVGYENPAHCSIASITNEHGCNSAGGTWYKDKNPKYGDTDDGDYSYSAGVCYKNTTCQHDQEYYHYTYETVNDGYAISEDTSTVIVPYNFELQASISIKDDVVYAGETASLKEGKAIIKKRYNEVTKGTYATAVPYMAAKVTTYVSTNADGKGGIVEGTLKTVDAGDTWPEGGNELQPRNWEWTAIPGLSVNVYDAVAGNYFCVQLSVYPANSGSFTNYENKQPDSGWSTSEPSCKIIAKKPSFQVWGGNIYSTGNIKTARAVKNNLKDGLAGRTYKILNVGDGNVFGSWGELSVMALGGVKGLASGAATADSYRDKDNTKIGYGKFESVDPGKSGFCKYESPLTFANYSNVMPICGRSNDIAGFFATGVSVPTKKSFLDSVLGDIDISKVQKYTGSNAITVGLGGTYSTITTETGRHILYTLSDGTIKIKETKNIRKGQTYIIHSDGKQVRIMGNIEYEGDYNTIEDIPKVVIYANTIAIDCGVTRVDAVLIAESWVTTCSEFSNTKSINYNSNDARLSNQLRINGTIITRRLHLKRTYGAASGANSGVPAEVINYDSSLVLWGRDKADTSETGILESTYTRELAPRY